ncbi:hypothetical protein [Empedobacter falsenii]|uniref:hypothetical protein n=1 Tax=Empedobacter falsenii TaxID=343874 RepID=UPI003A800AF3
MKISKQKYYSILLILLILFQLYIGSYKTIFVLELILLIQYFITEKIVLHIKFIKIIAFLSNFVLLGFVGTFVYNYAFIDIFKDFIFFFKPILGIILGYLYARKIDNTAYFAKVIVYLGLACAIAHLSIVIISSDLRNISSMRLITKDNFIECFSLVFLLFYKYFFKKSFTKNKLYSTIILCILCLSIFIYFSRLMFIIVILVSLGALGLTKLNKFNLTIIIALIFSIIGLFYYLNNTPINRNAKGFDGFLYKIKMSQSEIYQSKVRITDHGKLWDHWRAYEALKSIQLIENKPETIIYGNGFGSLINLKFHAPLDGSKKGMKYISHTHNGYTFILYKLGVFALFAYLFFIFRLYWVAQKSNTFEAKFISVLAIIYFFTTLTITGIYNQRDNMIIILGCLLFYYFNTFNKSSAEVDQA